MQRPVVWVEGLIGAGKTTLAHQLAERLGFQKFLEPVDTNPYLERFYEDPKRWAFPMQLHLMFYRYAMQQQASWQAVLGQGSVLDRGLPGDRVFCKLHMHAGNMDELEWQTYEMGYDIMAANLRVPSLILFLDVEPEIAMERIQTRARTAEVGISLDYLRTLRAGYYDLLSDIDSGRHVWVHGMKVVRWSWNSPHQPIDPIEEEVRRLI